MANVKDLKVPPLKIVLSSATSGGSDRSDSTSPSSESESLDSNLTIISDKDHQEKGSNKSDNKDDVVPSRHDKVPRHSSRISNEDRSTSGSLVSKRSNDSNGSETSNFDQTANKDHNSAANQRITRSSQRAAQQNKSENLNETQGDDTNVSEIQERIMETARKVKRRKGEHQDEQEGNQQVPPPPIVMADICPADYQLPEQNSFELYRDIRKRPYKKLMQLSHVQPRVPHGFKDYLLSSGPYLLDGNKIGVGIRGGSCVLYPELASQKTSLPFNGIPPKIKFTNLRHKFNRAQSVNYNISNIPEAPRVLKIGSPLYELFHDQEKSRQKLRLQHLKERERSTLAAEQEILRAYNKINSLRGKQDLNFSACTYFYYQERYHYIDERNDLIDCVNPKDFVAAGAESNLHELKEPLVASSGAPLPAKNDDKQETNYINDQASEQSLGAEVKMPDADMRILDKAAFLKNLQSIDDKWAQIKKEMMIRHKNECDSLFAVQCLEWEWKAKEIGACDVRVSLKIDPEYVPRIEILPIDY